MNRTSKLHENRNGLHNTTKHVKTYKLTKRSWNLGANSGAPEGRVISISLRNGQPSHDGDR